MSVNVNTNSFTNINTGSNGTSGTQAPTPNVTTGVQQATEKAAVALFDGSELVFDIIRSHSASLSAQITDNYVENNFAIHDHIAFAPTTVTLAGLVANMIKRGGEQSKAEMEGALSTLKSFQAREEWIFDADNFRWDTSENWFSSSSNFLNPSSGAAIKLGSLGMLIPQMSNVTRMASSVVQTAYHAGHRCFLNKWNNRNQAIIDRTPPPTQNGQSRIQDAYERIKNTFYARKPNKVYTPWATYDNMYIQSIEISQDEQNFIVDISVTLKQLRFSKVEYTQANQEVRDAYNSAAREEMENGGKGEMQESSLHKFGFQGAHRQFMMGEYY